LALAPTPRAPLAGLALTLGVHALAWALFAGLSFTATQGPTKPVAVQEIVWLQLTPPAGEPAPPEPPPETPPETPPEPPARAPQPAAEPAMLAWEPQQPRPPIEARTPATQAAPAAPTAEEWAFASRYALKNGKAYRYTWGQQVRSMMGTAVEGPDQGWVRFRVEIAPDGRLARLETLWTTSPVAERLARQAIEAMPGWPPTPNGKPLVFERTIAFTPFGSDAPPLYKDDCLPDPPAFSNPFAWDGKSAQEPARPRPVEKPDPQALEDCLKQLPKDSIEAEEAHDRRLLEQWASPRLGR
jgi:hypothetical protein